jgi:hypothetical protein
LNTKKIFQGGRIQKLRRRSNNNYLISCGREPGLLDLPPVNKGSAKERN